MPENLKNPAQFRFANSDMEIINEITIIIASLFHSFIKDHNDLKKMIEPFSKMSLRPDNENLARLGLTLNLKNMSHKGEGMFPNQINRELARILLKGSQDVLFENQSKLTHVLNELEDAHILFRIEGKKNIKEQSPKSIRRKPKAGEARRQGYHIVRKVTSTVEDYERILSNPNAVNLINKNLLKYGRLKEVCELLSRDAFDVFKKADTEFYNFLTRFGEPFPEINTDALPNPQIFQEEIKKAGQDFLEQQRKEFVSHLLENPLSGLFFIFSLAELENGS